MYSKLLNVVEAFDEQLKDIPAHKIVLTTAAILFLYHQYPAMRQAYRARNNTTYKQWGIDLAYSTAQYIPIVNNMVKNYINEKLQQDLKSTQNKLQEVRSKMALQDKLPDESTSPLLILKEFGIDAKDCLFDFSSVNAGHPARQFKVHKGDGKDSGALYAVHPQELTELLKEVYAKMLLSNPLHDKWPRVVAMKAEIIRWCQDLFNGPKDGYGLITHGGTTSIIEAISAYVIYARTKRITSPEIVVPETEHEAFKKVATLTGTKIITVPVDPNTKTVKASEMRRYISGNTAAIVGSAFSFMDGVDDPIFEIGKLAKEKGVPFHVDACLGGFLTAFLDTSNNPMDFRVPGVSSISADLHKYGCCPKGTSVCLFSNDSPASPIYPALNWSGGLYTTPGILDGSTSGARIAEIYATLLYYGRNKFKEIATNIVALRQSLQDNIEQTFKPDATRLRDIYIVGKPKWSVLSFRSETLNPHFIAEELKMRGWELNMLQKPDGFHLCLTHVHTLVTFEKEVKEMMDNEEVVIKKKVSFKEQFMQDLKNSINAVKLYPKDKKPTGDVKVYGTVGILPSDVQKMVCEQYQKARLDYTATCTNLSLFSPPKEKQPIEQNQSENNLVT